MSNIENLIWLAGMFEGEGTTGLFKGLRKERRANGSYNWRIYSYWLVTNNDAIIIDKINQIAKDNKINLHIFTRQREDTKDHNINYQIGAKRMKDTYIMNQLIYPYLVGQKKYISKLTMEFIKSREFGDINNKAYSDKDWFLVDECKKYNQRGREKKKFESSEAIRQALLEINRDDIVRTSMKVGECIEPKQYE